jgi:hypothetical protein
MNNKILYLSDIQQICENSIEVPPNITIEFQPLQQIFNGNEKTYFVFEIKRSYKSQKACPPSANKFVKGIQVYDQSIDFEKTLTQKLSYMKDYFNKVTLVVHAPLNNDDYDDTLKIYNYNTHNKYVRKQSSDKYKFIFCKHQTNSYGKKCIANINYGKPSWGEYNLKEANEHFKMVYEFFKDSDQFIFSSAALRTIKTMLEKPNDIFYPSLDFCIFLDDPDDLSYFAFSNYDVSKVFVQIDNYDEIEKFV